MNFLQPWMLWALPAIAIPVVIHLVHKRRQKVVKWGAMMFLLQGATMSRGMQRLRNFLLLTLRTLAVAGLVIGLGRPIAGGWLGGMSGGRPDTVLVLLDRSASMQEEVAPGGASKLDAGVARLAEALGNVSASRFAVIDSVTMEVTEMAAPTDLVGLPLAATTDAHSDIPQMLEAAAEHLRVNAAGRAEIWICTDGQAGDWRPEDGRWTALQEAFLGMSAGVRVNVLSYADRGASNLGVRVARARRLPGEGQPELALDFTVVGAPEGSAQVVPVAISLGGTRSVIQAELIGGVAAVSGHRLPVEETEGPHWGFVELPPDGHPSDNRFYFTYGDSPVQETVVVTEDEASANALRFAAEAPPIEVGRFAARILSAGDTASLDLDGAALLLWQAPLPSGDAAEAVERFLDSGGRVVFMPPVEPNEAAFLGYGWGPIREVGNEERAAVPSSWRAEDDLLRDGDDGGRLPLKKLGVTGLADVVGDVTQLAGFEDGSALLSRAPTSRGGLYFLGTTPRAADSNLAVQGVVLVALVRRALDASAEDIGARGQGDAGAFEPLGSGHERVSATRDEWLLAEHLEHAGVVRVGKGLVALNRAEVEDSTQSLDDAQLVALMPDVDVSSVSGGSEGSGLVEEVWRIFLMLILVGMIGEALLCITESSPAKEVKS